VHVRVAGCCGRAHSRHLRGAKANSMIEFGSNRIAHRTYLPQARHSRRGAMEAMGLNPPPPPTRSGPIDDDAPSAPVVRAQEGCGRRPARGVGKGRSSKHTDLRDLTRSIPAERSTLDSPPDIGDKRTTDPRLRPFIVAMANAIIKDMLRGRKEETR
jgi:hypothetical protein